MYYHFGSTLDKILGDPYNHPMGKFDQGKPYYFGELDLYSRPELVPGGEFTPLPETDSLRVNEGYTRLYTVTQRGEFGTTTTRYYLKPDAKKPQEGELLVFQSSEIELPLISEDSFGKGRRESYFSENPYDKRISPKWDIPLQPIQPPTIKLPARLIDSTSRYVLGSDAEGRPTFSVRKHITIPRTSKYKPFH